MSAYVASHRNLEEDMAAATLTTTLVLDVYSAGGRVAGAGDPVVTDGYEGYIRAADGDIIVVGPEYLSAHDIEAR